MRFAWVGYHAEGVAALDALLDAGAPVRAVFTLRPDLAIRRAAGGDYASLCHRRGLPLEYLTHINDPQAVTALCHLDLDVVFLIGLPQLAHGPVLQVARLGVIGAHTSLLPHNPGSSPITWTLMRGEREAGVTLLRLTDDHGGGEIIDQLAFPVTPYDTSATLFERSGAATRDLLLRLLPRLLAGELPRRRAPAITEPLLRRRRASDGLIDWTQPAGRIYDLVRALTRPYRGAFSWLAGRRWTIWQAALPTIRPPTEAAPGVVLGAVVSPLPDACGQLVACGDGALIVLEAEPAGGGSLRGPALSEAAWSGHRWTGPSA